MAEAVHLDIERPNGFELLNGRRPLDSAFGALNRPKGFTRALALCTVEDPYTQFAALHAQRAFCRRKAPTYSTSVSFSGLRVVPDFDARLG